MSKTKTKTTEPMIIGPRRRRSYFDRAPVELQQILEYRMARLAASIDAEDHRDVIFCIDEALALLEAMKRETARQWYKKRHGSPRGA